MKSLLKLLLSLVALLLLCGLVWWQKKTPAPTPPIAGDKDGVLPSSSANIIATQPPEPLPVARTLSQSNTIQSRNAAPKKKISEMEPEEAAAIMNEIRRKDIAAIFRAFLDAMRVEHDGMKESGVLRMLENALRDRKPNPEFLKTVRGFIEDASNSELERGMVIGALSMAATKETGELLIDLAATATIKEKRVQDDVISGILGLVREAGNEEFAPAITRIWRETTDPHEMRGAAMSMARSGAPASIELLLAAVLAPAEKDAERRFSAMEALREIESENAVPPLAAMLEKNRVGTPENKLALATLAQLGNEEAAQAVMKWLQATDSSAAPLAKEWVVGASRKSPLKVAKAALNPAVSFRSEANRKALREGIEAYNAKRKR